MRFKEITEGSNKKYEKVNWKGELEYNNPYNDVQAEDRFKSIVPILEANCKEIISIYKKTRKLIYRGASSDNTEFVARIRPDRNPGFLNKDTHNMANAAIEKLGGIAHRGNSIFCSSYYDMASRWGDSVYIIFPKDGWNVTFCKRVTRFQYSYDSLERLSRYYKGEKTSDESFIKRISDEYRKLGISFSKKELIPYLDGHGGEIMIAGDSYIALSSGFYRQLIRKWLGHNLGI